MKKKTAAKSKQKQQDNKKPNSMKEWEKEVKKEIPPGQAIPEHMIRRVPD